MVMIKPMLGNEANDKTQHNSPDDAHALTSLSLDVEQTF
jgi:hypothetical protein